MSAPLAVAALALRVGARPYGTLARSLPPAVSAAAAAAPPSSKLSRRIQARTFAGRKDRASTAFETRKPTRKQLKRYHRRRRAREHEESKHRPYSKAPHRRRDERETRDALAEIAREEEHLKARLGAHFDKVRELTARIESSPKFRALSEVGRVPPHELRAAAREAAKTAAERSDAPRPPLPSWWRERMTYDYGDALVDDLMGNSADLTSSPSPSPVHMGGEYGRLVRKVERLVRGRREGERLALDGRAAGGGGDKQQQTGEANKSSAAPNGDMPDSVLSDKLLSDLIRAHRDAHGKRTTPIGLVASLEMLREAGVALSDLGTWCYTSLLTCCKSPLEGREVDNLRREASIRSNEYFWSALVDVYARSGDYRGAEGVLDEMLEESRREHEKKDALGIGINGLNGDRAYPMAVPPLPAYTSFLAACRSLVSRPDVHSRIKNDAADRAWSRWKEMRIHSVAPDVMAYGALMRIFAAQGRAEKAVDLLEEVMDQMMMPMNEETVLNMKTGKHSEVLKDGGFGGWYDDRDGNRVTAKPTTLIFTSALKAVAKSHEIAYRFSGAKSKKNRRRESIASYHSRMTRKVVILAEQAEVVQDDGFVAALMLCAAAAGDSSTARAIYMGSRVRRMDHLRTCGGKDHLKRLQGLIPEEGQKAIQGGGASTPALSERGLLGASSSNKPALRSVEEQFEEEHAAYEHREYGNDTRILSALLMSHSKAMEPMGLGSMWAGRYNRGYLCPNSTRYMEAYNRPQMENLAIPGLNSVDAGMTAEGWQPEDFSDDDSKRLRKKHKFNVKSISDDGEGNTRDDMDPFFDGMDPDPDDARRKENALLFGEGVYTEGPGPDEETERDWLENRLLSDGGTTFLGSSSGEDGIITATYQPGQTRENDDKHALRSSVNYNSHEHSSNLDGVNKDSNDEDSGEGKEGGMQFYGSQTDREALVQAMTEVTKDHKLAEDLIPQEVNLSHDGPTSGSELDPDSDSQIFFDEEEWEKLMEDTSSGIDDSRDGNAEELQKIPGLSTNNFAMFKEHLEREVAADVPGNAVDEAEAKDLFENLRSICEEEVNSDDRPMVSDDMTGEENMAVQVSSMKTVGESAFSSNDDKNPQAGGLWNDEGLALERQKSLPSMGNPKEAIYADDLLEWTNSQQVHQAAEAESMVLASSDSKISHAKSPPMSDVALPRGYASPLEKDDDAHITELQSILPGLPMSRIHKVLDEFEFNLGYPSILKLALAVREDMPEAFGPQCLVRKNFANAKTAMAEAEKEGLVDAHLLNGMLRVHTNSGRIEPTLRFYDTEFKKHGMTPTTHSDRLLIEMLVKKRRITRAFKLKQDIERDGRTLDLLSYQTLVDYFGRHNQLGSALLLIKECIQVHGSPPGEKCLKNIRLLCRKTDMTDRVGLEALVGKDPMEWFRTGEELKRIQSKEGRSSDVMYGLNRMLDI